MKIKKPVTMAMIRDLVVDLAKNEDGYYDPVEVESFTFDSGYYTAMLLMGEEPGADDLELYESRLKLKRQVHSAHYLLMCTIEPIYCEYLSSVGPKAIKTNKKEVYYAQY